MSVIFSLLKIALNISIYALVFYCIYHKGKPLKALYLGVVDILTRDRQVFRGFGFWLYCGLGGSGKTISMCEYMLRMKTRYPKLKVYTNFEFDIADGFISNWQDIINIENYESIEITEEEYKKHFLNDTYNYFLKENKFYKKKHYGVLFGFDEIHLTFASQNWLSCPANMLEYISQQRKLHKQIVASSQVFTRIDKKLREQTNYVVECKALFSGRWILNKAYDTSNYLANGEKLDKGQKKRRKAWKYNFVAIDKIRQHYNTLQVMKNITIAKSDEQIKKDLLNKYIEDLI